MDDCFAILVWFLHTLTWISNKCTYVPSLPPPTLSRISRLLQSPGFSSVQFSHSVASDSLWPHGLQHARPPCPSPTPGVHPNPCLLSQWCHPAISSSVVPFSACPQSFPASESFQMSQLFASSGQSTGVSASASEPWSEFPESYSEFPLAVYFPCVSASASMPLCPFISPSPPSLPPWSITLFSIFVSPLLPWE